MAVKGEKATLAPLAKRLYADGQTLTSIADALGVSVQSLSLWKRETKDPKQDADEWDRARLQRRSRADRVRTLFDDTLHDLETLGVAAGARNIDALVKIGSLMMRLDKEENARAMAEKIVTKATEAVSYTHLTLPTNREV